MRSIFAAMRAAQEEGHAIVLSRVRREIRRGRLWTESKDLHLASVDVIDTLLAGFEVRQGVSLARALEIVEGIEGPELDVVFDRLNGSVDMRSRARPLARMTYRTAADAALTAAGPPCASALISPCAADGSALPPRSVRLVARRQEEGEATEQP